MECIPNEEIQYYNLVIMPTEKPEETYFGIVHDTEIDREDDTLTVIPLHTMI